MTQDDLKQKALDKLSEIIMELEGDAREHNIPPQAYADATCEALGERLAAVAIFSLGPRGDAGGLGLLLAAEILSSTRRFIVSTRAYDRITEN